MSERDVPRGDLSERELAEAVEGSLDDRLPPAGVPGHRGTISRWLRTDGGDRLFPER